MARNLKAFLLKNAMISDSVTTAGAAATTRAAYSSGMVPYTAYNNIVLTTGSLNVVLSTFGIVANLINLRTFGAMGGVVVDGVTLTLFTLSLSDLGLCVSSLCWTISWSCYTVEHRLITLHGRGFYFSVDPRALGIFFANVMSVFSVTTTLITIYLAMMRCLCVIFPLRFRDSISPAITALTFGMFFLVSLSTRLPILALMDIRPRFDPNTNLTRFTIWSHPGRQLVRDVTRSLVDLPLPVIAEVILTICVIVMVRALRASRKFRNVSTADVKFSSPEQPSSTHGTDHCSASSSEGKSSTGKSSSSSGASVSSGKPSPRTTNTHKVTVSGASTPSGKPSSRTTNTNKVTASGASALSSRQSPITTNTNNVPASGGSTPSGKLSPKESRVVKQLVIISFIFIACNLPKLARIIADSVEPEFAMSGCYRNLYDIASQVQFTAETLNSSVNLFIYLSFNARFRQKCHLPRLCK